MSNPSDALRAAFARVLTLTWRGVWLNLVVVALSVASLAVGAYHRPFPWTGVLTGLIVALAGLQLWIADGQFTRLGSGRPHGWVRPLALTFLVAGAAFLALGVLATMHRVTAT
jgi:hypothetical protein